MKRNTSGSRQKKYGFSEKEYLSALDEVPRINRETFEAAMSFYANFVGLLSLLSSRNIQLERSLMQAENTKILLKSSIEGSTEIIMVNVGHGLPLPVF